MNSRGSRRLFIALPVPVHVVKSLQALRQTLVRQIDARDVRWVRPEAMHLTLRFLGETTDDLEPSLRDAIDLASASMAPIPLSLTVLGCFRPRRPRVIWAGIADRTGRLTALRQRLDGRLAPLGWPPESKRYQPHLTLGRVRRPRGPLPLPWGQPLPGISWQVTAVHLVESELRPEGALHTIRHRSPLTAVTS